MSQPSANVWSWRQAILDIGLLAWMGSFLILNYPGHLSLDSLVQIAEGRSGNFESWNPPFISIVFGQLTEVGSSTGLLILVSAIFLLLSLRAVMLSTGELRTAAVLALLAMLCGPVLLIYPAIVWKDVWFAHAALAGFALMTYVHHRRQSVVVGMVPRLLVVGLVSALLAFAMLSRQTGILVTGVGCIGLACASPWHIVGKRGINLAANGLLNVFLVLMAAGAWTLATQLFVKSAPGAPVQTGVKLVMTYDIAGILNRSPTAALARFEAAGIETAPMRQAALATYRPDRIDYLQWPQSSALVNLPSPELYRQWAELIWERPIDYLDHRIGAFGRLMGFREQEKCVPIFLGFGALELVSAAGIKEQPTIHFDGLYKYASRFFGSAYFSPGVWGLISLSILILMVRKGWTNHPIAWLQIAGICYLVSYFPISIACDFRYTYFSTVAAHAGLIFLINVWPQMAGDR